MSYTGTPTSADYDAMEKLVIDTLADEVVQHPPPNAPTKHSSYAAAVSFVPDNRLDLPVCSNEWPLDVTYQLLPARARMHPEATNAALLATAPLFLNRQREFLTAERREACDRRSVPFISDSDLAVYESIAGIHFPTNPWGVPDLCAVTVDPAQPPSAVPILALLNPMDQDRFLRQRVSMTREQWLDYCDLKYSSRVHWIRRQLIRYDAIIRRNDNNLLNSLLAEGRGLMFNSYPPPTNFNPVEWRLILGFGP
jgi:hypothetical protein